MELKLIALAIYSLVLAGGCYYLGHRGLTGVKADLQDIKTDVQNLKTKLPSA